MGIGGSRQRGDGVGPVLVVQLSYPQLCLRRDGSHLVALVVTSPSASQSALR